MKCFSCNADNPQTNRFCTQCGSRLPFTCSRCGATSPAQSKFCAQCGANLLTPVESQHSPLEISSRLGETSSSPSERRHLTVLFCDIVQSTALAKLLDPEDLSQLMRSYYDRCGEAIRCFDGVIVSYIGDGIMTLFGYPRSHEDDAERAVHAALKIIDVSKTVCPRGHPPIRVRIGIASGVVVVGEDKLHALTREKSVVGETPNLAAHLQSVAAPNSVLISQATRKLVGDVFELEEMELHNLKGRSETAWKIIGLKASTSRFEAHVRTRTNFVGRDQEVALLIDRWEQVNQGEGQVVLLAGEAGIGKSRIVENFRQMVSGPSQLILRYQCSPYHVDSALYPVITELERTAKMASTEASSVRLEKIEGLLQEEGLNLDEMLPVLAALLSIATGDRYPPPDLDPQRRKERTLSVLVERIINLGAKNTVLMVVEDVHWADPTTLEFFGRLIQKLEESRILLIMTYRPEFTAPWTGHAHVTALFLNRLGRRHCRAMVKAIANRKSLPAAVMDRIIAKTDGVPLFVEELTKTLLESGLLREGSDGWVLSGPLQEFAIPATLHDSLLARLERLPSVKEVAQLGAAIGREFPYNLLEAVSPMSESDLKWALDRLASAELIFVRGTPPAASYVFKHALVQDAAYETMLKSKRQQLHGHIAKVLEDRFPGIAHTQPELLAHHYTEAALPKIAITWWGKAGELAIRRSADTEAVRHFSRAIELLQREPESRERDESELAMRVKLSGPLIATRGYVTPELAENYANAWQLCSRLKEEKSIFPVTYGQWVIPYVRGDMAAALVNSERFLHQAERQSDTGLLMMGHRIYGSSLVWRGDAQQGSKHLQQALSLYNAAEHDRLAYVFSQHPRTAALAHLCLGLQHLGFIDQAMDAGWQAISDAKRIGHFNSIAYSLCFVSLLIMLRRDVATLRTTAGELMQIARQYRASYWALWAKPMLGWIAAQEGNIDTGIHQMHESAEALQKQNANLWVPQTLLLEAEILGNAKQYQHAHKLLDAAQALIEPLDQRFYEAELHRVRGTVLMAEKPNSPDGLKSLDCAINVARRQNSRFLELRACVSKARVWRDRGLHDDARKIVAPVYSWFTEGLDTIDLREARDFLEALA
ncbi:MAG: adenylate/guanylate cyclase domain-containing protein [Xanthobacteraceae bacterium]